MRVTNERAAELARMHEAATKDWEREPKESPSNPLYVMDGEYDRVARLDGVSAEATPQQCRDNLTVAVAAREQEEGR